MRQQSTYGSPSSQLVEEYLDLAKAAIKRDQFRRGFQLLADAGRFGEMDRYLQSFLNWKVRPKHLEKRMPRLLQLTASALLNSLRNQRLKPHVRERNLMRARNYLRLGALLASQRKDPLAGILERKLEETRDWRIDRVPTGAQRGKERGHARRSKLAQERQRASAAKRLPRSLPR